MSQSNRVQLELCRETTPGTTPDTPRMRKMLMTGESLAYKPTYVDSEDIRDDRMNDDPILVMKDSSGAINFQFRYPEDNSPFSEILRSAFFNAWVNTPTRDNDGTADSVITDIGTATDTVACLTGVAFVAGHLVRFSGNTNSANDGIRKCTTGSATAPVFATSGFSADTAPSANSKMKTVGFQGASGDITALADGLGSTTLDFTTLGIPIGAALKIGGTLDSSTFAFLVTAGSVKRGKSWGRVTAVTAHKITLDNLQSWWTTDDGSGKTVKVWFGDQIKNGTTQSTVTIERGFLGQAVPTYIVNAGMTVNTLPITINSKDKIKGSANFMGMGGSQGIVPLDASPDPAQTNAVMAANQNVGYLSEAGALLTAPNWCSALEFTINNNLRQLEDIQVDSPVAVRDGECTVTVKATTYFGDNSLLAKFYNGTPTALLTRVQKNGQAVVVQFPRLTYRDGGNPSASAKNQDVQLPLDGQASYDALTGAHILMDRLPYYEA